MSALPHLLDYDLDSNTPQWSQLNLRKGYQHLLQIRFIKAGVTGYELPAGSSLNMFFHGSPPVDTSSPDFQISQLSWVWNPTVSAYEALFDTTVRPLAILGVGSFYTLLRINDGGTPQDSPTFLSKFLTAPFPDSLNCCGPTQQAVPEWFRQWASDNFKWSMLPGDPAFIVDRTISALSVGDGTISTSIIPIPATSSNPDAPYLSIGSPASVLGFYVIQNSGDPEEVEIGRQIYPAGTVLIKKPPSVSNTHFLAIVTIAP